MIQLGLMDSGSSTDSRLVLLSALEMNRGTQTGLALIEGIWYVYLTACNRENITSKHTLQDVCTG